MTIKAPYKFCDFIPAIGESFADYLGSYDYWGHCDVDLIWGNIRKFITDDVLINHKRVFISQGDTAVFMKILQRLMPFIEHYLHAVVKKVFKSETSCCYDEWAGHCGGGISQIMKLNGIEIYDEVCSADINANYGKFQINRMHRHKNIYFSYKNGKLEFKADDICKEVLCAHFQKREISIEENINYSNYFFVAPNHMTSDERKIRSHFLEEKLFEIKD